ncbi:Actin-related protein 8 [Hypsibius exemplaris]|uniref:Actin-related protein 8 n=1 Tax=Hypsibius exemplaris TaxID=2072580 RepID=A0A1W0WNN9_HYPEX|nr:Actin-related protein 8 [Hypsibius exemplaris]
MPRAKKYVTKLQPLTGDDLDKQLEKTLILHPGSRSIRMARPLDRECVVICHCIARRRHAPHVNGTVSPPETMESSQTNAFRDLDTYSSTKEFKQSFTSAETWLKENSNEEKAVSRTYCSFDAKESEEAVPMTKDYVVGNNALDVVALNSDYTLSWPLRYGRFNLHSGPGGSRSAVAADIAHIWDGILLEELEISRKERAEYRVVLIIPDIYDREDVRSMVEILLLDLGFYAVFVVLENVASMFGAAVTSACVVDVGAEKTMLSCVDEGISLPDTRILLHYGGDDITRLSNWFLHQKLRAFNLNITNSVDWFKMDAIKKALCHFDYGLSGCNDLFVDLPSPDREETVQIKLPHDFCRLTGLTLFFDGLIAPSSAEQVVEFYSPYEGSCEDIYGGGRNLNRKVVMVKKNDKTEVRDRPALVETSTAVSQDSMENSLAEPPTTDKAAPASDGLDNVERATKLMELHRAIVWSISRCATEEQQRRMWKNIVVVGGGYALFSGALEFLKKKLEELVPPSYEVEFVPNTRELPADLYAYKGASVIAALETAQYLWITKEEWQRNGVKVLREKSSFGW